MKAYTDLLHLLMCQKAHETDMLKLSDRSPQRCYYYLEKDISGGDTFPDHEEWKEVARRFTLSMGFKSEEETLAFIRETITITQKLRELVGDNSLKMDFIFSLLK